MYDFHDFYQLMIVIGTLAVVYLCLRIYSLRRERRKNRGKKL